MNLSPRTINTKPFSAQIDIPLIGDDDWCFLGPILLFADIEAKPFIQIIEQCEPNLQSTSAILHGVSLLAGFPVDANNVIRGFASHAAKNRTNAYMLKRTAEEQAAISRGDREGAVAAFKYMQDRFQKTSNEAKNAGLYVDFKEGQFIAPTERITEVMVAEIATLNRDFLSAIGPELRMLNKWNTAPQDFQKQIVAFAELAEA